MSQRYLRTTDIAYALAVHPNTVRQYEEWGLLPPIPRSFSGYRQFTENHLDQMRLARTAMAYTWLGGDISQASYAMIQKAAAGDLGGALECAYQVLVFVQSERTQAEVAASLLERWAQGTVTDATVKMMRIGEVAKYINVTSDMLRNWERNGLIQVPRDLKNGYRQYGAKEIGRLRVIRVLRRSRYSMMAILRMLTQLDRGEREGLRLALDTPRADEDIGHATDKWLSSLAGIEPRVRDTIAQLEMMLQKRTSPEQTIEGKILQPVGRAIVIKQFSGILKDVLDCISAVIPAEKYRLCGAAAGMLQGVFQPVHGIHLLGSSQKQVEDFAQMMHNYPKIQKPTFIENNPICSTAHLICGVEVCMTVTDTQKDDENLVDTPSPWNDFTKLKIGPHILLAERLELQLATALALERPRHYQPLIKHLKKHRTDIGLLERAMQAESIPAEKIAEVISQINSNP